MTYWRAALLLCFVLLAACGPTTGAPRQISPAASAYLNEVLDLMQQRSINRDTIDWPRFRAHTFVIAEGAQTTADTYSAIRFMISRLDDNHSSFIAPEQHQPSAGPTSTTGPPLPRGEIVAARIGYLWLPYLMGNGAHANTYASTAQQIIHDLDVHEPCGWIVDLSENQGGNMWPMLVGVGPILGEGEAGRFVDPTGATTSWSYLNGQALLDTAVQAQIDGTAYTLKQPNPPVAVLTGKQTASSGEAIAVAFRGRPRTRSFGQRTAGLSTGNESHTLSDGAVLVLTEVTFADRTGALYGKQILPDEQPWPGTSARDAATKWLFQQPACAH